MTGSSEFRRSLEQAINRTSSEGGSNTPDFILAEYLMGCLSAFDLAVARREAWYGRSNAGPRAPTNAPTPADSLPLSRCATCAPFHDGQVPACNPAVRHLLPSWEGHDGAHSCRMVPCPDCRKEADRG